ncbi:MAG: hypothetical protein K940chlam8_01000 [Chlamydiae bacterium]|nr:hypothetical protein [Chlamydiota bacterium]
MDQLLKKQLFPHSLRFLIKHRKKALKTFNDPKVARLYLQYLLEEPKEFKKHIPLTLELIHEHPEIVLNFNKSAKFLELLKENQLLHFDNPAICDLLSQALKQDDMPKASFQTRYLPKEIQYQEKLSKDNLLQWIEV